MSKSKHILSEAHRNLDLETETLKLEEMNTKLKTEVIEEEGRLKRLQTQVSKTEREVVASQKRASPSAPIKVSADSQIHKLQTLIADVERKNETMRRNLLLLKHAPPASTKPRRTHKEKPARAAMAPAGLEIEIQEGFLPADAEPLSFGVSPQVLEQHLLVEALKVELTRAEVRRKALEPQEPTVVTGQLFASQRHNTGRIDAMAIENMQREIKEMDARLMILEYTQQQTSASLQAQREQEKGISQELADLSAQLDGRRTAVHDLERQKSILLTLAGGSVDVSGAGGGGGGGMAAAAAEQEALRAELATLHAENRAARGRAFSGAVVQVQAQVQDEERAAARVRIERLRAEQGREAEAEAAALAESARLEVENSGLTQEVSLS